MNHLKYIIKVIERNLDFFQHGFWVFTKARFTQDRFHLELYRLGLACVYMGPALKPFWTRSQIGRCYSLFKHLKKQKTS